MQSLTISVRMPKAFGLRMWLVATLIDLAGMISPVKIEAVAVDEDDKLSFDGHLHRVDVRNGDKFIMKSDRPISAETCLRMQDAFKAFAGQDTSLLIVDPGLTLSIMRVEPTEAA